AGPISLQRSTSNVSQSSPCLLHCSCSAARSACCWLDACDGREAGDTASWEIVGSSSQADFWNFRELFSRLGFPIIGRSRYCGSQSGGPAMSNKARTDEITGDVASTSSVTINSKG